MEQIDRSLKDKGQANSPSVAEQAARFTSPTRKPILKSNQKRDMYRKANFKQTFKRRADKDFKSFGIFSHKNWLRRYCMKIHDSKFLEGCFAALIVLSCLSLHFFDFSSKYCANKPNCDISFSPEEEERDQALENFLFIANCLFLLEIVIKTIATGLFQHKRSYLRSSWNVFDFVMTMLPFLNTFGVTDYSFNSMRIIRLIKYGKNIKSESFKLLSTAIVTGSRKVLTVLIFFSFILLIFSIVGLQIFSNNIYTRCRFKPEMDVSLGRHVSKLEQSTINSLCDTNKNDCPNNSECVNFYEMEEAFEFPENELPLILDPADDNIYKNPSFKYGFSSWDNIGICFLNIFGLVTFQNFNDSIDTFSKTNLNQFATRLFIYFASLFGGFFIVKLILANQNEILVSKRKEIFESREDAGTIISKKQEAINTQFSDEDESANSQIGLKKMNSICSEQRKISNKLPSTLLNRMFHPSFSKFKLYVAVYFGMLALTVVNTVFLCLDGKDSSAELKDNVSWANVVLGTVFQAEVGFRILVTGKRFFYSFYNWLDLLVSLFSVYEIILFFTTGWFLIR